MKRWLFNLFAGLSLVVCGATAGLWVRSYWRYDSVLRTREDHASYAVRSLRGRLYLERISYSPLREPGIVCFSRATSEITIDIIGLAYQDASSRAGFLGMGIWTGQYREWPEEVRRHPPDMKLGPTSTFPGWFNARITVLVIPHWMVMVVASVLPLMAGRRWLRQARRRRLGLCLRCGYDLRASRERCPECGEPNAAGGVKGLA
jgi:hypothetical protein